MIEDNDKKYFRAAVIWILCCAVFRFFYSQTFPLAPDEANYWQWSRHLAMGYHDQAPLLAWAIKCGTLLLGHSEMGVRLPSVLSMLAASLFLAAISGRWISKKAAFYTALLTQGIPEFNVGGLLATPDGLQAAAWAGAVYHGAAAYEKDEWRQWLACGFWFGFGMLSKYTMVLFLPSAFLYGLLSSPRRKRLAGIRPYAGVALGLLMFAPVVIWNAQNDWNSLRHVAYIGGANESPALHWRYIGDFFASQAALLSPLVFILVLAAWGRFLWKREMMKNETLSFLFFTSFPMFAFFTLLSLHTRVYGNWPGAAYLSASVMVAAFFSRASRPFSPAGEPGPGRQRIWKWAVATACLFSGLILLHTAWPVLPVPGKLDRTATEISGWPQAGARAHEILKTMPAPENAFVFGLSYQMASELAFYVPGRPRTVSINRWKRPNVYDYWQNDADLMGRNAVGVTERPGDHLARLGQVFERVEPAGELDIFRKPVFYPRRSDKEPVKTYYFYRAYGFKGGTRWLPPNPSDIRVSKSR
ncbi:conserved membrane hypothetical protein [Candidatus Desulfarcum epimagneticum]|uniref:Glycosyltransferase RgtA/B/C/D-like domain-containing protein n=1 Tax=uncultured Desulfobacteraceae bacterium TaxID=218296 RepID=A0A484HBC5_9BACT|nr:conserved membrane hypothetical protein [uncultured Desulfobacteraceae bacterium]